MSKTYDNKVTLLVQFILTFVTATFFIIAIFEQAFNRAGEIFLMLTLGITAYNNYIYSKRTFLTLIYLLFAIFIAITIIFNIQV